MIRREKIERVKIKRENQLVEVVQAMVRLAKAIVVVVYSLSSLKLSDILVLMIAEFI